MIDKERITIAQEVLDEIKRKTILTLEDCEILMSTNFDSNLSIRDNTTITELPDNLVVPGNLILSNSSIKKLPKGLIVNDGLDISFTDIKELPDDLKVKGSLSAAKSNLTTIPSTVSIGSSIDLRSSTRLKSLPDNLTVFGYLDISNTTIKALPKNLKISNDLNMSETLIRELPDDIVIGGSLFARGSALAYIPKNLVIPRNIDICDTNVKYIHTGTVINGSIIYNNIVNILSNVVVNGYRSLYSMNEAFLKNFNVINTRNKMICPTYIPGRFIFVDCIMTHVDRVKTIGEYTFYIGKIKHKNVVFDGVNYAHCESFKQGVRDLLFKKAKDRGLEQFRYLTMDSELFLADAMVMYRIITGACEAGVKEFVNNLPNKKDKYTIREIIKITNGQYGSDILKHFFSPIHNKLDSE